MTLRTWHLQPDTPRRPHRASPGEPVELRVGTSPVQPGQSVWASLEVVDSEGHRSSVVRRGQWLKNELDKSYWSVDLGRFSRGDRLKYRVFAEDPDGAAAAGAEARLTVGPKLHVALLWHHHQPLYRELDARGPRGAYRLPWVRLHALRDYFGMAELVRRHPGVHLSINLTPVLLWQIDDYIERGATDRALELTLVPAEKLTRAQRDEIVHTFFDADPVNQVRVHRRYHELYEQRARGDSFGVADLRDLQMWFNLAWFGVEHREGSVELPTGELASVARWVARGSDFTQRDVEEMVAEQYKVLRAVVPAHRKLQDTGQVELCTTPFFHPILPLLIDSDSAVLDRPGTWLPERFAHPEDADAQTRLAIEQHVRRYGRRPRGVWPAEGAVSPATIACLARQGVEWVATDRGVLEKSGRWGYRVDDPSVLCRSYRASGGGAATTLFFRETSLCDDIGFRCHRDPEPARAAHELVTRIKERFARRVSGDGPRVLTLALDGENPWGAYPRDGRPFLEALYAELEADSELETVTFSEVLSGSASRLIDPPDPALQHEVFDLAVGSWADETGSAKGVDLGTWIGESEENRAWALLGRAREALILAGKTPDSAPGAFEALYAAEGSDWFWWYGTDQDSGHDEEFDALFRAHLRAVYRRAGLPIPQDLHRAIVPAVVPWSLDLPDQQLDWGSRLAVRTHCPGSVEFRTDDGAWRTEPLIPAGGVMSNVETYNALLGPFDEGAAALYLRLRCRSASCDREEEPCAGGEHVVVLGSTPDSALEK